MVPQQTPTSLRGFTSGFHGSVDYNTSRMKGIFVPSSSPQTPSVVGEGEQTGGQALIVGSVECLEGKQVV